MLITLCRESALKAILLLSFTILLLLASGCASIQNEPGSIEVHFCPQEDCATIFTSELLKAKESVNCALYDIDEKSVWLTLEQISKRVPTKIVMDNDYKKEAINRTTLNVKFDNKNGLMHNKFCVIDNKITTSGSMNPTFNDIKKNFNNLIIINSDGIANNYVDEFNELWSGKFRSGSKNSKTTFSINGTLVEQYFCPEDDCEKNVIDVINAANESIKFMTFSFTSMPIATALIEANDRGIKVDGLYEKSQVNAFSIFDELKMHSINATIAKSQIGGKLHHKVFIIDKKIVIAGSYNPTGNGNKGNDENLLIIHDAQIAEEFLNNYNSILNASKS